MLKNIFFDLDGTLLGLDMDIFLKEYLSLLGDEFQDVFPKNLFVQRILEATQSMVKSRDGSKTNREVFKENFFDGVIWKEEELGPRFQAFYENTFPKLSFTARAIPGVLEVLSLSFQADLKVVIATNPVFPREATLERLRWAGILHLPFSFVTTYEDMHYCKPQLYYYEEILERIGGEASETLMVGNDVKDDMVAKKLGLKTFLLKEYLIPYDGDSPPPDDQGYLEDLKVNLKKRLNQ